MNNILNNASRILIIAASIVGIFSGILTYQGSRIRKHKEDKELLQMRMDSLSLSYAEKVTTMEDLRRETIREYQALEKRYAECLSRQYSRVVYLPAKIVRVPDSSLSEVILRDTFGDQDLTIFVDGSIYGALRDLQLSYILHRPRDPVKADPVYIEIPSPALPCPKERRDMTVYLMSDIPLDFSSRIPVSLGVGVMSYRNRVGLQYRYQDLQHIKQGNTLKYHTLGITLRIY